MKQRFEGEAGRRVLIDSLRSQKIVGGNQALAEEIAEVGELIEVAKGIAIIEQSDHDNDVYLILTGTFAVVVNGKNIGVRGPNDTVGEMAAVQQAQVRSASIIANETAVVMKLTEPQLAALGGKYTEVYRAIAKELASRLMQRNILVSTAREKIHVFIISSAEALPIAQAIQNAFEYDPFTVIIWANGVFRASQYPVESLEKQLDQSDFAIAIAQPDDSTQTRDRVSLTPRDNVIFELGFFMGRLGRHRSLLLEPRGEEVKLPSDLSGITTIPYKYDSENLEAALGPACNRIRDIIKKLGPNI